MNIEWAHPMIVALIATVPSTLVSLLVYFMTKYNKRQIQNLRIEVNGRLEKLLETTDLAAQSKGELKGAKDEQDRQNRQNRHEKYND